MRKGPLAVIFLCLILALGTGLSEGRELHALWGIPFDSTWEEVVSLAQKNAGVVLGEGTQAGGAPALKSAVNQELTFFGYPVNEVFFHFDQDKTQVRMAGIDLRFNKYSYLSDEEFIKQVCTLYEKFHSAYGEPDYMVTDLMSESHSYRDRIYNLGLEAAPSENRLTTWLKDIDAASFRGFRWIWANVRVTLISDGNILYGAMRWQDEPWRLEDNGRLDQGM